MVISKGREKVFEADALKNKVLVISSQTAFEIEYLVEISYTVEINSDNFEGLAKLYNRMHNHRLPTATSAKREDLCRKRMTDAYMTYVYQEFAQRYGIRNYQVVGANIDDTILKHKTEIMNKFRERWAFKHRCDTPGCGWCLKIDGGLNHTGCICSIFRNCRFSNVSSNGLLEWMQSHIGCICLAIPHCESSNVSLNGLPERMHSRIGCICLSFLHCVFSNVSSKRLHKRMQNHIGCIFLIFPYVD